MKITYNYTEVYRIEEDGSRTLFRQICNVDDLQRQLAHVLLDLQDEKVLSFRTIDGGIVDPLREAERQVKLSSVDPIRGYFKYGGKVYVGEVLEHRVKERESAYLPQNKQSKKRSNMNPKIELKYDEKRDSFYIDCGSLDNARHVLNLIMYAVDCATSERTTQKQKK